MKMAIRTGQLVASFVIGFGMSVGMHARSPQQNQKNDQSRGQQATRDDHPRLPPGEGRDVMIRVCSQCHSPDSAADEQRGPEGWQDLINQMIETGAEGSPREFDLIVKYLSKAFPQPK